MFALSPCVVLEAVFPYRRLNTLLLLHFIITVAILAVTVGGDYSTERNGTERNGMMD